MRRTPDSGAGLPSRVRQALLLARFWFTCLWEPRKLLKEVEKPSYAMALLNLAVAPVLVTVYGLLVLAAGEPVGYARTVILSITKYFFVAAAFGLGAVNSGKGSLRRMVCFSSFPITGYLLLVDAALLAGGSLAGIPAPILMKSLLVFFAVAIAGIAHHEAKMKWWKAGVWAALVLALADYLAPHLAALL